jgi:3-oxoacyl-ACP reductase-like protein
MQLFNKLMSKIFGQGSAATTAAASSAAAAPSAPPQSPGATASNPAAGASSPAAATPAPAAAGSPAPASVDVDAVLTEMASKNSEKLDWKKSIVDLMKLVGMDSSLSERKELAKELGYTGDMSDSATMNVWLHKQVLRKLADNGGKVPQNLLD